MLICHSEQLAYVVRGMANNSSVSAEDIENNLRLFALRKAASSSKEFSGLKTHILVKVDSSADVSCPRHGQDIDQHTFGDMSTYSSYGDIYRMDRGHEEIPKHVSRKEMARELRLSAARQEREAKARVKNLSSPVTENGRRGSSFSPAPTPVYNQYIDYQRSESVDPWPQYNSMPRRASANPPSYLNKNKPVHRHGSFQEVTYGKQPPPKVDVFKGRVDFKSILRRFDPKDDERSSGGQKGNYNSLQKSKVQGGFQKDFSVSTSNGYDNAMTMSHRPQAPKRGAIVDSDFDFRGSAPALASNVRSMSPQQMVRPLSPSISTSYNSNTMFPVHHSRPLRPQKLELDISSKRRPEPVNIQTNERPLSPNSYQYFSNSKTESNPVSPRRVEFSEQVFSFSFAGNEPTSSSAFPPPPLMVSSPLGKKPILRQSNSDPNTSSQVASGKLATRIAQQEKPVKMSLIQQFEQQEIERRIQQQLRNEHERMMSSMNMVSPLTIEHTNLDEESTSGIGESGSDGSTILNQRRKVSSDSLVQIYVPPTKSNVDAMKNLCLTPENATTNFRVKDNPPKDDSDSTESDSDSNDISDTSGAASTSVNTTFDAEGGDDESDDGTLSARTHSFEELEKELDRSQGEEIIAGGEKEGVPYQLENSNEVNENISTPFIENETKQDCDNDSCTPDKKPAGLKAMRTLSAEVNSKKIAPMLADWNRSQSFPLPEKSNLKSAMGVISGNYMHDENNSNQNKGKDETGIFLEGLPRKCSFALSASTTSVNNEGRVLFLTILCSLLKVLISLKCH